MLAGQQGGGWYGYCSEPVSSVKYWRHLFVFRSFFDLVPPRKQHFFAQVTNGDDDTDDAASDDADVRRRNVLAVRVNFAFSLTRSATLLLAAPRMLLGPFRFSAAFPPYGFSAISPRADKKPADDTKAWKLSSLGRARRANNKDRKASVLLYLWECASD